MVGDPCLRSGPGAFGEAGNEDPSATGSGTSWGFPRSQKEHFEDSIIEDPELEEIKASGSLGDRGRG